MKLDRPPPIQRILEAASEEFAVKGYAGARVDAIAKKAKVNKASIYYYLGDKQKVYEEVLGSVFQETAKRLISESEKATSPEEKIRAFIQNIARSVDKNSHMAPIMLREVVSGGKHLPDAAILDMARIISQLDNILTQGRDANHFQEVSPILLHLMIIGTIFLLNASGPIRERFFSLNTTLELQKDIAFDSAVTLLETLICNALQKEKAIEPE